MLRNVPLYLPFQAHVEQFGVAYIDEGSADERLLSVTKRSHTALVMLATGMVNYRKYERGPCRSAPEYPTIRRVFTSANNIMSTRRVLLVFFGGIIFIRE